MPRGYFVWHELMTTDVEAAIALASMDVPGGKIAHCTDPQGAAFALHQTIEGK